MKTLVAEDDFITSQVMKEIMLTFGKCDIAENGALAVKKFQEALEEKAPYNLVFLDIMMPEMDGQQVLEKIRDLEQKNGLMGLEGAKIIMTTALDDFDNIKKAFINQCEGYIVKPVDRDKIVKKLYDLNIIE
jgi:two-component system, chemotaxis family, chemotaxis protein CheY